MTDFLHGVETFELLVGPRPIQQVRSAVIGLVGTAPVHHSPNPAELNRPTLVLSDRDNGKFGPDVSGYTIPAALQAIQDQGAGIVIVINVFDPSTHKLAVSASDLAIVDGVITLPHQDVLNVVVKEDGGEGAAKVLGVDYELDAVAGKIRVLPGGSLAGDAEANVAYDRAQPGAVDSDDIVGGIDVGGQRYGAQALLDADTLFGFKPKILIAPSYSSDEEVRAALQVLAQESKLRAVVLCDSPVGAVFEDVLGARGTDGEFDMQAADQRVFYYYPWFKVGDELSSPSARFAGVIAKTDADFGYWRSPSNKPVLGVTGIEIPLTASISDPNCDVNMLNAAGIVTTWTGSGRGIRTWGNRSSAFPGSSDFRTFMSVRRTIDVVDESIEIASAEYVDGGVDQVAIDAILEDVGEFLKLLVTRKALAPGSRVEFFPEDNPATQLAAGQIVFTKTYCPPGVAERITYKSLIDTRLLQVA